MRRIVLAGAMAFGLWAGFPAALLGSASNAVQTARASAFVACVKAVQGDSPHHTTLKEARLCGLGLPEIPRAQVATTNPLPHLFLVVDGSRAALEGIGGPNPMDPANAAYAGCYNSYANPVPWWFWGDDWGQLNATGFGNHCNYANMTGETPSAGCILSCSVSITNGTADSNWNRYHYGINSALGWSNNSFSGSVSDFWACRAFVDTSGRKSPSSYCS